MSKPKKIRKRLLALMLSVALINTGMPAMNSVHAAEIAAPTTLTIGNYGKYTGVYVVKFDAVTDAVAYNIYMDGVNEPIKTVKGSGECLTNSDLNGYAYGNHTFYVTAVAADNTESEKSVGITTTTAQSAGYDDIAQIYVQTDQNIDALAINKGANKLYGSITVVDNEGKYETIAEDAEKTSIKVRGNTTAEAEKKAFNISFGTKRDLFGLGKKYDGKGKGAKKWSLLANAFDKSLIRNKLAMNLNEALGVPFTSQSRYVDLYLNGTYMGNYLLIESVEAGKDRVNIDSENPESKDILIELENNGKDEQVDYFNTSLGLRFNIGSPERGDMFTENSPEDTAAIAKKKEGALELINGFEDALKKGDFSLIEQYINVDSFVNFYLASEIFKTQDINFSSTRFYITKKDGDEDYRLYAGPPWDFDLSSGNVLPTYYGKEATSYEYWKATELKWFSYLMGTREFKEKVILRFYEKMEDIEKLYQGENSDIQTLLKQYGNSFKRNYIARDQGGAGWSVTKKDPADGYSYANVGWASYDETISYLENWLEKRIEWLTKQWDKEYYFGEKNYTYLWSNSEKVYEKQVIKNLGICDNIVTGNKDVTVTASSGQNSAGSAIDGNIGSRWESEHGVDPQTFTIDLGKVYERIREVDINWEEASAKKYIIEVSTDGVNYTTAADIRDGVQQNHRADEIRFIELQTARYIRITGTMRSTNYGYSIFELAVYTEREPEIITSTDVNIEGNQMSANYGGVEGTMGLRTIYSVEPQINEKKVHEVGMIYGIVMDENPITTNDMTIDNKNEFVYHVAATNAGKMDRVYGDSQTATYYARTVKIDRFNAQGLTVQYYVRPYAILEDGTIAYGKTKTFTIYDVAEKIYLKSNMNTEKAHDYLYNKVLKIVKPDYLKVEYGWTEGMIKPDEM